LEQDERARIHGFIINNSAAMAGLFEQGLTAITRLTAGLRSASYRGCRRRHGFQPKMRRFDRTHDSLSKRVIAVPVLARIANFDDLDHWAWSRHQAGFRQTG